MSKRVTPVTRWLLNGEEVENPTGMTIMEAASEHGVDIPLLD